MAQLQSSGKGQATAVSSSIQVLPVEVVQLLDVLARIETRRQAKLRAVRKEAS